MQLWQWVKRTTVRFLGLSAAVPFGVLSSNEVVPEYPAIDSLSAISAFPLVRATFRAKAIDLAGLPLIAVRIEADGTKRRIANHPIVESLSRPHHGKGPRQMRAQLAVDWWLTGNAYLYRQLPELGANSPLIRLHPESVKLECDPFGVVIGASYQSTEGRVRLNLDGLLHIADVSWRENSAQGLGTGAIQALHNELTTDMAVRDLTTKAAQRGRPDFLFSPKNEDQEFDDDEAAAIIANYETSRQNGNGAMVVGGGLEATPLNLSPRDVEFVALGERIAGFTFAVSGVPPVKVGHPTANYGTSKQQMRNYWEGLMGEASLLDEQLSQLDPDPRVYIVHDFSRVEALQTSRTEQMQRARMLYEMGADAIDALRYEGFHDAPVEPGNYFEASDQGVFRQPEKEPDEGQERADRMVAYLEQAAQRYQARTVEADGTHVPAVLEETVYLLAASGETDASAYDRARRAAALIDEAVHQHLLATPGAVRIDVASCKAFTSAHAARLAVELRAPATTEAA